MADRQHSFFVPGGGNLALDAPSYILRSADTELYTALLEGSYCYVLTSRQMGKSSMMVRTAARLREAGGVPIIVDLTGLGAESATVNQWYTSMLLMIGEQFGLEDEIDDFLSQNRAMSPLQLWRAAIREIVCTWRQDRIVIFIDEIDVTQSLGFTTNEFFVAIREMYNARTVEPALNRLTFCLLGAARPADLIEDRWMTPFNIGIPILLTDFTSSEAAPLAFGLLPPENEHQASPRAYPLLSRILYWTGGQPYLTQALCARVAKTLSTEDAKPISMDSLSGVEAANWLVDEVCTEMFFASDSIKSQQHLGFVQSYLLRIAESNPERDASTADSSAGDATASIQADVPSDRQLDAGGLLLLYARVLSGRKVLAEAQNVNVSILQLAGVVREENGLLHPRNRIYARVFDKQWVYQHMPQAEQRRRRSAYIQGALRGAALIGAAATLLFMSLFALNQTRSNTRFKRIAFDADIKLAQDDWEEGNVRRTNELLDMHKEEPPNFATSYLHRLAHSNIKTLNSKLVFHVAYSPDGRLLAAACNDKTVQIWNTITYQPVRTLQGHTDGVLCVSFSADGHLLATASIDKTVRLWDVAIGNQIDKFRIDTKHGDGATCVAFAPNNRDIIVAGDCDGTLWVWDRRSKGPARSFRSTAPSVQNPYYHALAFAPDGSRLVATGWSGVHGLMDVWDTHSWTRIPHPNGEPQLNILAFSPDGSALAVSQWNGDISLLDAKTLRKLYRLSGFLNQTDGLAFSHKGHRLAAAGWDNTVRLWDWKSCTLLKTIKGHTNRVTSVAFSKDDSILASGGGDGVKLWNVAEQCSTGSIIFPGRVSGIALSPTEPLLAVASGSQIALFDRQTQSPVGSPWNTGSDAPYNVVFSPDGRSLLWSSETHKEVCIWDVHTRQLIRPLGFSHAISVNQIAMSPDSKLVAASTTAIDPKSVDMICIWDAATGREMKPLKVNHGECGQIAFSPDGSRIVCGRVPNDITVWDINSGKLLATFTNLHKNPIESVAWSPDGKTIATTSWDSTVRLWDSGTFASIAVLRGHNGDVKSCCFSPDSQYLVTGGEDGLIKYWDIKMAYEDPQMAREILTLKGHVEPVNQVLLSSDNHLLVSCSNHTVKFWRANTP